MSMADWGGLAAILTLLLPVIAWIVRSVVTSIVRKENADQTKKQNEYINARLNAVMVQHLDRHHGIKRR